MMDGRGQLLWGWRGWIRDGVEVDLAGVGG